MTKQKTVRTRTFDGITFKCERPGVWLSVDGRYGIYCMMAGLACEQWEVYKTMGGEPLYGDMISLGLTMAEAVRGAFREGG